MNIRSYFNDHRKAVVATLTVVALLAVAALLTGASASSQGVVSHRYSTLYAGTTGYTAIQTSTATDVGLFGALEVQGIVSIVPATGTVTATMQWSEEPVPCTTITNSHWTSYATVFNPYGISASQATTVLTATGEVTSTYTWTGAGAMTSPYIHYVADAADTTTLNVIAGFPVLARCFRVVLTPNTVTTRYTPTLYLRLVNHQ